MVDGGGYGLPLLSYLNVSGGTFVGSFEMFAETYF